MAIVLSCQLMTSCQKASAVEKTTSSSESESESEEEDDGISVGDHIMFGSYPQRKQDGTDSYDPEPVEWRVLEIRDGNALIISEYLLDTTAYYYDMADVTWETSSIRKWLNDTFYEKTFSENEKSQILTVSIKNPDNPLYGTPGGNDTEDKVFCLSLEEARLYFRDAKDRMAAPTDFALKQGAAVSDDGMLENGMKTGWWWLRSPASSANRAADADCYGNIDTEINADRVDGDIVFAETNCVRPVILVKSDTEM